MAPSSQPNGRVPVTCLRYRSLVEPPHSTAPPPWDLRGSRFAHATYDMPIRLLLLELVRGLMSLVSQ